MILHNTRYDSGLRLVVMLQGTRIDSAYSASVSRLYQDLYI
jgi:hypothetical protein